MDSSDDQAIEGPSGEVFPSPIKKYKQGKIVSSDERLKIVKMYKEMLEEVPYLSIRKMEMIISGFTDIGKSTVHRTINEYKETKTVNSPEQKRARVTVLDLCDDYVRNTVRRHVHNIWLRREIPNVDKVHKAVSDDKSLPAISRTDLFKLLRELKFHYSERSSNNALIEKNKIVLWRRMYLRSIRQYREEGRHVYYLDETWDSTITSHQDEFLNGLTTGAPKPTGKGERLIVMHIGSEDGFVPGGLLCFKSKTNSRDYHDDMNGQIFYEWMENILPQLRDNSVIVMDNASYHSVKKDKAPMLPVRKADIIKWLEDKGEIVDKTMIIHELLERVKRIKPLHEKFVIDELAKANNKTILRLPPHHSELNPIELAWASVKNHVRMNNTTFKVHDIENLLIEGIERIDTEMWKNFISRTKKVEDKFWEIDCIVDEVLATEIQNLTITRNTSFDSESD